VERFQKYEVLDNINKAEDAIIQFNGADTSHRRAFVTWLILPRRQDRKNNAL